MDASTLFIVAAVGCFAIVPFVPALMRLRISILRFFRWSWLAVLHQNHFNGFVLFARIVIFLAGIVSLVFAYIGWPA